MLLSNAIYSYLSAAFFKVRRTELCSMALCPSFWKSTHCEDMVTGVDSHCGVCWRHWYYFRSLGVPVHQHYLGRAIGRTLLGCSRYDKLLTIKKKPTVDPTNRFYSWRWPSCFHKCFDEWVFYRSKIIRSILNKTSAWTAFESETKIRFMGYRQSVLW